MLWDLSISDWILLGVGALVAVGAGLVAAIRALWLYQAPTWLRRTLLSLFGGGLAVAIIGLALRSETLVIGGIALGLLPFGGWLVTKSISYSGPPPGLLSGPKALDAADEVLDSVSKAVGLGRSASSDEHDH